jgi:hypothetical protein
VDWDQDGNLDILSGCYWTDGAKAGHIMMLKGKGTIDFAAAVSLKNTRGDPLENAKLGENDNDDQILTICTQQHAVDYDGDGDLDLVVGCFGPNFYLYENTGGTGPPAISETPVELPIKSTSYHSAPHLVDWDSDGDLDLLSGSSEGGVLISENAGTRQKPIWAPFRQLIPPSNKHEQSTVSGEEIAPSPSTRVWATDWNGDGHLDLLLGDSATITNPKKGISKEEFAKLREANAAKMQELQKKYEDVFSRHRAAIEKGEQPSEELGKEINEYSAEMGKVYFEQQEFQTSERTGFVWLYIRRPITRE